MYSRIIIFGCGGHARSVISTLEENTVNSEIILVDENAAPDEVICGYKVVKGITLMPNDYYHVAIGDNYKRKAKFEELKKAGTGNPLSIVSKHAIIRNNVMLGDGVFISAFAYVGPFANINDNTIINTSSVVEHESVVGSNCHICPGAVICGRTKIGNQVVVGAGTTVIDKLSITDDVIIGAGATVVCDIDNAGTYIGVPAKKIIGKGNDEL